MPLSKEEMLGMPDKLKCNNCGGIIEPEIISMSEHDLKNCKQKREQKFEGEIVSITARYYSQPSFTPIYLQSKK